MKFVEKREKKQDMKPIYEAVKEYIDGEIMGFLGSIKPEDIAKNVPSYNVDMCPDEDDDNVEFQWSLIQIDAEKIAGTAARAFFKY